VIARGDDQNLCILFWPLQLWSPKSLRLLEWHVCIIKTTEKQVLMHSELRAFYFHFY